MNGFSPFATPGCECATCKLLRANGQPNMATTIWPNAPVTQSPTLYYHCTSCGMQVPIGQAHVCGVTYTTKVGS